MTEEFRLRIAYGKRGRLRWLSHLEVVRALERMVRRAALPYAVTQGFSPHMKIAFGPALPVGTAAEDEYADVWLTRYTGADEALRRLAEAAPADLRPHHAVYVPPQGRSLTAALTIATYRIEFEQEGVDASQVQAAITELVGRGELAVEHKGKPKVYDLTRSLPKEVRVSDTDGGVEVELTVRMGPEGSLRPEVLLRAALERSGLTVPAVRTTRLDTFIESDEGVWSRPV